MGGGMVGGIANDTYNNDVGKWVVYAYEAYEANKGWWPLGRLFAS